MREEIAALLYREWDPLGIRGIAPADEYESYADDIESMLEKGCSAGTISDHLSEIRATQLLMAADAEDDRRVAELLKALRKQW